MRRLFVAAGLGVALALAAPAQGQEESAAAALARAVRNQNKLRSYRVAAVVRGGAAQGPEHRVSAPTVNQSYSADVLGHVVRVRGPEAFRPRLGGEGSGAVRDGAHWRAMLATDDGRLLARLFVRPEEHLAQVVRLRRAARWLPAEPGADERPAAPDGAADGAEWGGLGAEEDDGDARDGAGTRTPRPGARSRSGGATDGPRSNRIRVEGPQQDSIAQFTRIVNSGCFTEG